MSNFLEQIIFFYILKHPELIVSFKGSFFSSKVLQVVFNIVKPFVLEYKTEPSETQVIDLIRLAGKDDIISQDAIHILWQSRDKVSQYTEEWLNENSIAFAEWQNFMLALKRVITYVKTTSSEVTFENCKEVVEKAKSMFVADTNFSIDQSEGHDFFDPQTHALTLLKTKTTGYPFIDLCLNGGFSKKTLNVFMGSPKVGKSMWLCNLAAKSVLNGNNSIYITLEMSYQMVSQRIGSNLFEIPIDQYKEASEDANYMAAKIKDFNMSHLMVKPGKFFIEEFPTSSATVYDIESFILKKEEELSTEEVPFKFDNIFIDYINIMKDYKNPNSENTYQKIKSICEDVRAMAQRNNWCVVSVTQTNRSAFDLADINMNNVSESAGLIATVDSLFGIIQTGIMRAEGVYYLKGVAMRDSSHMGDKKKFTINKKFLRIDEDTQSDIIPENIEIPTKYGGHQSNGFNRGMFNKNNQEPAQASSDIKPELGLTELQISGQSLFS